VTTRPRLYLNHDTDWNWLIALEYGETDDGQPKDNWNVVADDFAYLLDRPVDGRCLGFRVNEVSEFDLEDEEVRVIWEGPRFDAPQLGLINASAGEILLAAREFFGEDDSINRFYFDNAIAAGDEPQKAAFYWRCCLQAGDVMAHYGLGYTLLELDRPREAYRHLRAYTEIVPSNAWGWCYRGQACEALGDTDEARQCYAEAVRLEDRGGEETDAPERLRRLTHRGS
jgi:tetratricopeptide (TPR) repeat protein